MDGDMQMDWTLDERRDTTMRLAAKGDAVHFEAENELHPLTAKRRKRSHIFLPMHHGELIPRPFRSQD